VIHISDHLARRGEAGAAQTLPDDRRELDGLDKLGRCGRDFAFV
jgi:hypothetical protein